MLNLFLISSWPVAFCGSLVKKLYFWVSICFLIVWLTTLTGNGLAS